MDNKDLLDHVLSDVEKDLLITFMAKPVLVEAVKKVVLASVYFNGTLRKDEPADPARNAALSLAFNSLAAVSNENLGADIRALTEGVRLVETGFSKLDKFKSEAPKPVKTSKSGR